VFNSESIAMIRIKWEHLLYSNISWGMIGYGCGNVCYIVNSPPGEYLLYNKVSGGKVYYIVNIPGEGLLWGRFTIRHRNMLSITVFMLTFLEHVVNHGFYVNSLTPFMDHVVSHVFHIYSCKPFLNMLSILLVMYFRISLSSTMSSITVFMLIRVNLSWTMLSITVFM
jgi:hypothetical protein